MEGVVGQPELGLLGVGDIAQDADVAGHLAPGATCRVGGEKEPTQGPVGSGETDCELLRRTELPDTLESLGERLAIIGMDELEEVFFSPKFDQARFFQGANEVLDAIALFWDGLEDDRRRGEVN